ncbi:SDR family NAD(P)-dependent oxidoreductase [Pseudomonas sp.]|uniref:SDR family NAD(P)-dependent oxidoreductase n=1 Tax=Pseudomonas sp. TaxID=306 RepID=UPI00299DC993|nr:SDR family NAD(P)-dependent oxidoreductase [Pseudomonas sp.]MDX1368491.1 SDR family NAD(P)-dependent oxidoreductase [Pseudomonas sp.]
MSAFNNKVCLVTGGTSGIGRRVSERLWEDGAQVIVFGRDVNKGEQMANSLGRGCHFMPCDVADPEQIARAFKDIEDTYGRLDCAFNNAGITAQYASVADSCPDNWQQVININVNGTYHCLRHELGLMLKTGEGGAIVNTSSCAGVMPIGGQVAYVASKQAINAMTQVASIEYAEGAGAGRPIRVNAVAPGPILGGMNSNERLKASPKNTQRKIDVTAMKRFGTADEVANAVLWLLSEQSTYVTGIVMPIDGGYAAGKF